MVVTTAIRGVVDVCLGAESADVYKSMRLISSCLWEEGFGSEKSDFESLGCCEARLSVHGYVRSAMSWALLLFSIRRSEWIDG